MAHRIDKYAKMLSQLGDDAQAADRAKSLAILHALSDEDKASLDDHDCLPSKARLASIARQVGCSPARVAGLLKVYLFNFSEGLRPRT